MDDSKLMEVFYDNAKQAHLFNEHMVKYREKLDEVALNLSKDIDAMWERFNYICKRCELGYESIYNQNKLKFDQANNYHRNGEYCIALKLYIEIYNNITSLMMNSSLFYTKYGDFEDGNL